ncbi:peptide ABC transporter substrate-binding protein [Treponema pedis]|uniref:peptide ABC transporter substrate-binding protein n=1 Tax=Treponema pedis TaxID=409322 RepID=UPI000422681B|nr:peptide ABC transporter substrate-binding protein [Treponema pedis]
MKTKYFFLFLSAALIITACSNTETSGNLKSAGSAKQEVTASLGAEPAILDAAKASDRYSFIVLDYINEHLTNIQTEDGKRSILPGIAESWKHNEDFTEWTFYLREAFWSDGVPVTANDFVYSIRRIINKESASPMAMYYDYIKNAQAILKGTAEYSEIGIIAENEKTLKIFTETPVKHLDELAAKIPPQREDFINTFEKSYGSDADKIICCGAFKAANWIHNSKIELVKNEKFWNAENVKLERLTFKIINEENAALGELIGGGIDIANAVSINWIDKLKKDTGIAEITGTDSRVQYVFMNQKDKLFSNKKIRQAVSASLNREEICSDLFDNIYKPAYGFVSLSTELEGQNYRNLAGEPIKTLIQKTPNPKALFIEGLKELGMSGNPEEVTIEIMFPTNESSKFNEYLQQSLSKTLGVNIILDKVEGTVFKKRNKTLDYQIGFKSWAGGVDSPARYLDLFLPGNKIVPIGWENEEYNKLVTEAKQSTDFNKQLEGYKRAEEILLVEECCIAPYANQTYNIFMQKRLKNVMQFYQGTYNLKYSYIED